VRWIVGGSRAQCRDASPGVEASEERDFAGVEFEVEHVGSRDALGSNGLFDGHCETPILHVASGTHHTWAGTVYCRDIFADQLGQAEDPSRHRTGWVNNAGTLPGRWSEDGESNRVRGCFATYFFVPVA